MDQLSRTVAAFAKSIRSELRQIKTRLFRLNKTLQRQTKDITKTYENARANIAPSPEVKTIVNLPERIEIRKENSEKKATETYQSRTLFVQRATLVAIVIYAILTAFIYCANKKAAEAAKSAADTARDSLVRGNRPWLGVAGNIKILQQPKPTNEGIPQYSVKISLAVKNFGLSPALRTVVAIHPLDATGHHLPGDWSGWRDNLGERFVFRLRTRGVVDSWLLA
jgi:hypothetical protein